MKDNKDSFSKFVEESIGNFEVPYNSSHWDEMNGKLDTLKPVSGVSSGIFNKLAWTAAAIAVITAAWFIFNNDNKNESTNTEQSVINPEKPSNSEKFNLNSSSNSGDESSTLPANDAMSATSKEKNQVDKKLEKYAAFSDDQVKEESKNYVKEIVDEQKGTFTNEPKIDNLNLKTEIVLPVSTFCEGEEIPFDVDRIIEGSSYFWNFGDNALTSRKPKPNHVFKKPGTYTITLLVSKGEKNDYKAEKTIVIEPAPMAKIEQIDKEITLNYPYVDFTAKSNDRCEYSWEFNENEKATGPGVQFLVPDMGSYSVNLIATSQNGCKGFDSYILNAPKGLKIFVEDAFTPNGNGSNDHFMPKELTISDVEFALIISDKNGQVVFETTDKFDGWNGNLNNTGNMLPAGVYIWKLTFKDDLGKMHKQGGTISLIR